jgi:hypothetical protein
VSAGPRGARGLGASVDRRLRKQAPEPRDCGPSKEVYGSVSKGITRLDRRRHPNIRPREVPRPRDRLHRSAPPGVERAGTRGSTPCPCRGWFVDPPERYAPGPLLWIKCFVEIVRRLRHKSPQHIIAQRFAGRHVPCCTSAEEPTLWSPGRQSRMASLSLRGRTNQNVTIHGGRLQDSKVGPTNPLLPPREAVLSTLPWCDRYLKHPQSTVGRDDASCLG